MHKDARNLWQGSNGIRCHACTARDSKREAAAKNPKNRPGAFFVARPADAMVHAMSDPVLTYPDPPDGGQLGGSGLLYPPADE